MNAHIHKLCLVTGLIALGALSACDKRTPEEKGKAMAEEKIGIVDGVGKVLEERGKSAGESIIGGIGQLGRGAEAGLVKTTSKAIEADPTITQAGLDITKVQDAPVTEKNKNGIDVYIASKSDVNGKLRAVVFDAAGKEIGRASVQLKQSADDAQYQYIPLAEQIPLTSITKVKFEFKPSAVLVESKK